MKQTETRSDQSQTELMLEVTRRFNSTLELDQVLHKVLSLTSGAIGAERGSIFVTDQAGQVTHKILARWYLPPQRSQEVVSAVLSQGAAGFVYRCRESVLIADVKTDKRWICLPDDPYSTRSALCVPLLYRDRLKGILTLTHSEPQRFDESDLTLVEAIAGQAAVAVENASLFERVRDERATLHAVISDVGQGIIITDTDGQIQYVNPAGATALGTAAGKARGQFLAAVSPDSRLADLFQALLAANRPQRGEIFGSEGRVFEASLVLTLGAGVVISMHDVTHFKEMATHKSEFVTAVAHDLKSPLGLIYGYAWMLNEAQELNPETRHYVDLILDGVQDMEQLVISMLELTAIEADVDPKKESVDLCELIRGRLGAFGVKMEEKNIELALDLDPALSLVQGHPVRLGQAIANLVSNAVKYTPAGGRITISAGSEEGAVLVRVSDTGPGIPANRLDGLFKKFFKVGSEETIPHEGHGLGLTIVKSVVEAHGGRVWVESVEGEGSTFAFALPAP